MNQLLNIVDNDDNIIGIKTREEIHKNGLLHREIHVYFVTPKREVFCQHRAKDKDTFPDLLDATVGGHVEIGDSYEKTAIKETLEETGIKIKEADLIFIRKKQKYYQDNTTKIINYAFRSYYLYYYNGDIKDLKIETGKALGFELWPIDKLINLDDNDKNKFIPYVSEFITQDLVKFIKKQNNL